MSTTKYNPPDFWSFKPFFTLQPVLETREKQLNCWTSLILGYCSFNQLNRIDPASFPLFKNSLLERQLSQDGIQAVIHRLIASGSHI
jgi:ESCRT-II complex subunit VPS25